MQTGCTIQGLLDAIEEFLENEMSDIFLPCKNEGEWTGQPSCRKPKVFKYSVPIPEAAEEYVPYYLIQVTDGGDTRSKKSGDVESTLNVRILVTSYDEDPIEGSYAMTTLVQNMREKMLSRRIINGYEMTYPFEFEFVTDNTLPYHLAEVYTTWKLPAVNMNVDPWIGKGPWAAFLHGDPLDQQEEETE